MEGEILMGGFRQGQDVFTPLPDALMVASLLSVEFLDVAGRVRHALHQVLALLRGDEAVEGLRFFCSVLAREPEPVNFQNLSAEQQRDRHNPGRARYNYAALNMKLSCSSREGQGCQHGMVCLVTGRILAELVDIGGTPGLPIL